MGIAKGGAGGAIVDGGFSLTWQRHQLTSTPSSAPFFQQIAVAYQFFRAILHAIAG